MLHICMRVVIGVSFLVLSPGVWARALPPARAHTPGSRLVVEGGGGGPAGNRGATLASLAVSAVPGPEGPVEGDR